MSAAVNMAKSGWTLSPRLSFSHDIHQSELLPEAGETPALESSELEFDFSTSMDASMQEPSSADELFSDGKILPLPLKNPVLSSPLRRGDSTPAPGEQRSKVRTVLENDDDEEDAGDADKRTTNERKSFWRFGRSSSVGQDKPKSSTVCPFRRSKSTGYESNKSPSPNRKFNVNNDGGSGSSNGRSNGKKRAFLSNKGSWEANSRTYYYSGVKRWPSHAEGGVRISPVLNMPAAYLPRGCSTSSYRSSSNSTTTPTASSSSVFGYLLCKCSNKGMETREVTCSP